eukprot:CAMPEP_0181294170 /NCGR_PEP_ID=MMETSP1101-20121128/3452_1 /TAXON_ID=46948 /ORGANISM="Rhodomonas abbreviata, Strain Caron Lab Isolate" /LENGTH=49 /DNA_ID=CAMNT_0023398799 /DNA_START=1 /DNA_END=150 /DNA_ORIENTATION=-
MGPSDLDSKAKDTLMGEVGGGEYDSPLIENAALDGALFSPKAAAKGDDE